MAELHLFQQQEYSAARNWNSICVYAAFVDYECLEHKMTKRFSLECRLKFQTVRVYNDMCTYEMKALLLQLMFIKRLTESKSLAITI